MYLIVVTAHEDGNNDHATSGQVGDTADPRHFDQADVVALDFDDWAGTQASIIVNIRNVQWDLLLNDLFSTKYKGIAVVGEHRLDVPKPV